MVRIVNGEVVQDDAEVEEQGEDIGSPLLAQSESQGRFGGVKKFFKNIWKHLKTFWKNLTTLSLNCFGFKVKFWIVALIMIIPSFFYGFPFSLIFSLILVIVLYVALLFQRRGMEQQQPQTQQGIPITGGQIQQTPASQTNGAAATLSTDDNQATAQPKKYQQPKSNVRTLKDLQESQV